MQPATTPITRAGAPLLIERVGGQLDLMVLLKAISNVKQPVLAITSDRPSLACAVILQLATRGHKPLTAPVMPSH
jgi:hypothetical protein